ncbi:hypothetical protein [Methanocalculus sp.]|uniref:hypothetical protein n=1 Tax=Methanocalculus sp. TaxID=2004547 RepID=UPI00179F09CB|nr:hypothetical protein [Methanocalculus sp.]HIJ05873.1 hypothetical protein [Methanocalculus sp.]
MDDESHMLDIFQTGWNYVTLRRRILLLAYTALSIGRGRMISLLCVHFFGIKDMIRQESLWT